VNSTSGKLTRCGAGIVDDPVHQPGFEVDIGGGDGGPELVTALGGTKTMPSFAASACRR